MFKTPSFWYQAPQPWWRFILRPFSLIYRFIVKYRLKFGRLGRVSLPVICVGNLVAGGAGKTPTVLALQKILEEAGEKVAFLMRGYGGKVRAPLWVDPAVHRAEDVGDEALLLAAHAPTWVAEDRFQGAQAICQASDHFTKIVMDDGFQNPTLFKDCSFVVVDQRQGLGNGAVIPEGPLREPLSNALERADGIIFVEYRAVTAEKKSLFPFQPLSTTPVFRAQIKPDEGAMESLRGKPLVAFAGIGYPPKFFQMLQGLDLDVCKKIPFKDHHPYTCQDMEFLMELAQEEKAILVTTVKDSLRIPDGPWWGMLKLLPITLSFEALAKKEKTSLLSLLTPSL